MYTPPKKIAEAARQLDFSQPLEFNDPRYVDTEKGRGVVNYNQLFKKMGFELTNTSDVSLPESGHTLFCGHIGCGKSTELRKLGEKLKRRGLFYVVFVDVALELDTNNLQYPDLLMALAYRLCENLKNDDIEINSVFLTNLQSWFDQKIATSETTKRFAVELKAGIEAEAGIPFLAKLFGKLTNSLKMGTTYKEALRRVIKNHVTEFADAFHLLINAVESETKKKGLAEKVLFIVDGTDKLSGEDSVSFFIKDANQLKSIEAHFLYGAPIHLIYSGNQVQQRFEYFILPMIKITAKDGTKLRDGYEVMRKIVLRRADISLFENPGTIDKIIEYSGGSPRELMRLLKNAYLFAEDKFTDEALNNGIADLATTYKRMFAFKDASYFRILAEVDSGIEVDMGSEKVEFLLFNLALFEYNNYFWKSHPVVRLLDSYKRAVESVQRELSNIPSNG
ncbi:MAG: ATP-binding protein [Nitrospirae bacterium]|nr:ATP-binding protein [Nitrospirota bacterium]